MPNLISLTLHYQNPNTSSGHTLPNQNYLTTQLPTSSPVLHPTPVYLPALEYLSISCREQFSQSIAFFVGIRTPHLKTLRFHFHQHTQYLASWFRSFVDELTLEDVRFTKDLLKHMTRRIYVGKLSSSLPLPSPPGWTLPSQAYVGRRIRRMRIDRPSFADDWGAGIENFVAMIKSRLPRLTPERQSYHDAAPGLPPTREGNLASLWITTRPESGSLEHGDFRDFQDPAAGLYQLLVKNIDIRGAESLGVDLVLEEASDGPQRMMRGRSF
ncbi:hypothetical protein P691DRAFT_765972 [Macrolepiota fuliginosa MF-IS2]|uniref:Uncharacterized protein n=1 Tax=Macrolepiota fuliginosa MF-IS2 TaxID=1400762 RepID=A0A9P6BXP9_9AGAR|nr:hypothetical protein P691DRAFT_765972 [Macrolepiota fuliginosa MF-IS2]